ncbi:MAG: MATE family efflux transporter [Lachnospiraceae bacterium]|nr:MATE family efflux transporter [Lachnospiraceae bacterium]
MNKNEELMRNGSVWKAIFTMAIPSVVIVLVMIFYNIADMFFIGQLGDAKLVASISVVGPLFSIVAAVAMMLGNGGCSLISAAFGAKDYKRGKNISSLCFWTAVFGGVIISALLILFSTPMLHFLGANEELFASSKQYYIGLSIGAPFMMLSNMLSLILKSEGAVKESFMGNIIGTVLNLILDPIFIMSFKMGVTGAALASVLGNFAATIYYIYYVNKKSNILSLDIHYAMKKPVIILSVISLGLPNAIGSLLSGFAGTFSNQLLGKHGTMSIAAMAAANKCTMITGMTMMGIVMGCQALIAFCYGAQDEARLKEVMRKLTILTVSASTILGIICMMARRNIIQLFIQETSVLDLGVDFVSVLLLSCPIIGIGYIVTGYFQGTNRPAQAIAISILRQGAVLIVSLYVLEHFMGLNGIPIAYVVADVTSAVVASVVYFACRKNVYSQGEFDATNDLKEVC